LSPNRRKIVPLPTPAASITYDGVTFTGPRRTQGQTAMHIFAIAFG